MKKDVKLIGDTVEVKVPKTNYSMLCMCNYMREKTCYECNFLLKDNETGQIIAMEDYDGVCVDFNIDGICVAMRNFVHSIVTTGEIAKYMDRMKYFDKCFCKGNAIIEHEG